MNKNGYFEKVNQLVEKIKQAEETFKRSKSKHDFDNYLDLVKELSKCIDVYLEEKKLCLYELDQLLYALKSGRSDIILKIFDKGFDPALQFKEQNN